jgi:hypothetical protein
MTHNDVDQLYAAIGKLPKGNEFLHHMRFIMKENEKFEKRIKQLDNLVSLANEMNKHLLSMSDKDTAVLDEANKRINELENENEQLKSKLVHL